MTDYYCPKCGEHPQFIVNNPATGKPHCHSCGTVLQDAREDHDREIKTDYDAQEHLEGQDRDQFMFEGC